MRTLFINNIEVGTIKVLGGEDFGLEGEFMPNEQFEPYRELFRLANSDLPNEQNLAQKAQEKIETELKISMLDHEDYTHQDIDIFIRSNRCYWREIYGDSETKYIYFYHVKERFGEFSNFWPPSDDVQANEKFKLIIDRHPYKTTEHFFQSKKFEGLPQESEVINSKNAYIAAKLGRELGPLRSDWDQIKDEIMYKAVHAKFSQNNDLRKLLLSTGKSELIEHTKKDHYWADGGDGSGKNMLGKILMKVREEFRKELI